LHDPSSFAIFAPKVEAMATITLEYNGRNKTAKEALDQLLTLGLFKKRTGPQEVSQTKEPNARLRNAIEEAERGDVIHCGSYENYLRMTGGNA
jgi:hypothetical protein